MNRKEFLKGIGLAGITAVALPAINACSKDDSGTNTTTNTTNCSVSPSETAGPFPTKSPSSLVVSDIRSDRTGVPLSINITIKNANANNAILEGAIVDIWHCDKDGYYSEYGGTGMQTVDYTAVHFLRGRQTTNTEGKVAFTSIFPGWYTGRATHIHVHIYNASGNSLLVTQIAFPEGASSAVALVNASTANGYTKGMSGYTYNAVDNVFADSAACELCSITGTVSAGYVLESTIKVSA